MSSTTPDFKEPVFKFGQTLAADYVPEEGGTWIRSMKPGSNQMRLLPAVGKNAEGVTVYGPDAWATEREHYEPEIGSYACINDHGSKDCIGCKSTQERVRKRKRNYYVQAIDKDGELRIFKFGVTVFKVFQQRHQRAISLKPDNLQPLSSRDYFVHKSGSGLKTEYDVDSGDPYEAEWPQERLDIPAALQEAYQEAMARYRGDKPRMDALPDQDDAPWDDSTADAAESAQPRSEASNQEAMANDIAAEGDAQATAETAKTRGQIMAEQKAAAEAMAAQEGALPKDPSEEQIKAADTAALKAWLDAEGVEYPARAQRTKLESIAIEAVKIPY